MEIDLNKIITLLNMDDWLVGSEEINIAKGKYKSPTNWKEFKNVIKRR